MLRISDQVTNLFPSKKSGRSTYEIIFMQFIFSLAELFCQEILSHAILTAAISTAATSTACNFNRRYCNSLQFQLPQIQSLKLSNNHLSRVTKCNQFFSSLIIKIGFHYKIILVTGNSNQHTDKRELTQSAATPYRNHLKNRSHSESQ